MTRPSRELTGISLLLAVGAFVDLGRRLPVAPEPRDETDFTWLLVICGVLGLLVGTGAADRWRVRVPMLIGIGVSVLGSLGELGGLWPEAHVLNATSEGVLLVGSFVLAAELVTGDPDAPHPRRFAWMTAFLLARHAIHAAIVLLPTDKMQPHPVMAFGALVDAFVLVLFVPKARTREEPKLPQSPYRAAPLRIPKPMPSTASLQPLGALIVPVICLAFEGHAFVRTQIYAWQVASISGLVAALVGAVYFTWSPSASPLRAFSFSLVCCAIAILPMWFIGSHALTVAAAFGGVGGAFAQIVSGYVVLATRRSSALPLAAWFTGQWLVVWLMGNVDYLLPIALIGAAVSLVLAVILYRQAPALQARFE